MSVTSTDNFIRIKRGIFAPEFIERYKGKKVVLYPEDMGLPSLDKGHEGAVLIPCAYEWRYTATAACYLNDQETIDLGRDCDYVVLYNDELIAYLGMSLAGYIYLDF